MCDGTGTCASPHSLTGSRSQSWPSNLDGVTPGFNGNLTLVLTRNSGERAWLDVIGQLWVLATLCRRTLAMLHPGGALTQIFRVDQTFQKRDFPNNKHQ